MATRLCVQNASIITMLYDNTDLISKLDVSISALRSLDSIFPRKQCENNSRTVPLNYVYRKIKAIAMVPNNSEYKLIHMHIRYDTYANNTN